MGVAVVVMSKAVDIDDGDVVDAASGHRPDNLWGDLWWPRTVLRVSRIEAAMVSPVFLWSWSTAVPVTMRTKAESFD